MKKSLAQPAATRYGRFFNMYMSTEFDDAIFAPWHGKLKRDGVSASDRIRKLIQADLKEMNKAKDYYEGEGK